MKVKFKNFKDGTHIATVTLHIEPKVGDRYMLFGKCYEVDSAEHNVTVSGGQLEPIIVDEFLECDMKPLNG